MKDTSRTVLRRVGVVTVTAALVLSTVGSAAGASTAPAPDRGDLQSAVNDWHTLGAVGAQGEVSVGHRAAVARSGVADRATGAPMPLDGHFRIGSNTKTFVAVVVLQLVGEGRLSLDDAVPRPAARPYQQFAPDGPLVDVGTFNATAADAAGG